MASILDDLAGILPAAELEKLKGNAALKTRLERGDELRSYYDGEPEPVTPPAARNEPPPVRATPPPSANFDLSSIEALLDKKLGTINTTIESKINETVERRGTELVMNAVGMATQRADELNRIYHRHSTEFGEAFDSTKFNDFLMLPENSVMGADGKRVGSKFRTTTEAYDAMIAPRVTEKKIADGIAAGVAAKSGAHVPGTTPMPATSGAILAFQRRGGPADGAPATGAQRAAAALDKIMSRRNEAAS
jgi:hypothetical protein